MSDASNKPSWRHLRLRHLFLLQLLFVPLFLAPLYERIDLEESKRTAYEFHRVYHPLMQLVMYLIAPATYTGVFSYWTVRRVLARRSQGKRSIVFSAVRGGVVAGFLFGTLLFASFWINWNWLGERQRFEDAGIYRADFRSEHLLITIPVYAYLLTIGASLGGVIGIAVDARNTAQQS